MIMNPPELTNISVAKRPAMEGDTEPKVSEPGTVALVNPGRGTGNGVAIADGSVSGAFVISGMIGVTGNVKVTGTIESAFLAKLREKFSGANPDEPIWPPDAIMQMDEGRDALVAQEFIDVFRALFMLREAGDPPPADGAEGSAKKLLAQLIAETGWPDFEAPATVPVPPPWDNTDDRDPFRRYEISAAMDVLMRLYHAKGPAGGSDLPPDR